MLSGRTVTVQRGQGLTQARSSLVEVPAHRHSRHAEHLGDCGAIVTFDLEQLNDCPLARRQRGNGDRKAVPNLASGGRVVGPIVASGGLDSLERLVGPNLLRSSSVQPTVHYDPEEPGAEWPLEIQ